MKYFLTYFLLIIFISNYVSAGDVHSNQDSSHSLNFNLIFQPRLNLYSNPDNFNEELSGEAELRRLRLRFSGFILNRYVEYFIHLGVTPKDMESMRDQQNDNPGVIYDAWIKWHFLNNLNLTFGQNKLPGNLSRLFSFRGLSFTERSEAENFFTP